jgi:hypothetical protein
MIHSRRIAGSEREIVKSERGCRLAQLNENRLDVAVLQILHPRNHIRDGCERSRDKSKVPRKIRKLHAPSVHVVLEPEVFQQRAEKICLTSHDMQRRSSTCRLSQVFFGRNR